MAARFSSSIQGYGAAVKTLKRIKDQGVKAHRKAVDAMTKAVFDRSQYYCPVDTGALKETAYWTGEFGQDTYRGQASNTYVTYIIYPQEYAVYAHEVVTHFHEPPTRAKFISTAVNELYRDLNQIAGEAYHNAFFAEFSAI